MGGTQEGIETALQDRWTYAEEWEPKFLRRVILEATAGFEPAYEGFADPCLATWLRRPEESGALKGAHSRMKSPTVEDSEHCNQSPEKRR